MATLCHTQAKARRKELLEESLFALMKVRSFQEITVKDICAQAQMPRRTFYHYFESKEDVLNSMVEGLLNQCLLDGLFAVGLRLEQLRAGFLEIFRFWVGINRSKLDVLIQNGLESILMTTASRKVRAEKIRLHSAVDIDPKLMEIILMVGVTDFFTLLFHWSRSGYRESPEEMTEYAIQILPQAYFKS